MRGGAPRQRDRGEEGPGKKLSESEALAYHLCLRLGFPHPDYLYPWLSGGQFIGWQNFAAQFGLGIDRDDIHWGMLLSMFFNVNREGGPPKTAEEFMPYRPREEESDEDFLARLRQTVATIKGLQQ